MSGQLSRRDFLVGAAVAVVGVDKAVSQGPVASSPAKAAEVAPLQISDLQTMQAESTIVMMEDLRRALKKPVEQRQWTMIIDLRKCVGCSACSLGCIAENKLPPGVIYRPVFEEESGTYPDVKRRFIPRPCMQCEEPPCVSVCPVGATEKRKDGIVDIDYDRCIGCRLCGGACPYNARTFDEGKFYTENTPKQQSYEQAEIYEYAQPRSRKKGESPIRNARKCHFCIHRLALGILPACVVTCIGRATLFGDRSDPKSLVATLLKKEKGLRIKENLGTKPQVYYLGGEQ